MAPAPSLQHLRLSPEELRLSGLRLFGDEPGWQSRLASSIGFDRSAVTRWLTGVAPVPLHASLLIRYMLQYGGPERGGIDGPVVAVPALESRVSELERLRSENESLRDALEPFSFLDFVGDDDQPVEIED